MNEGESSSRYLLRLTLIPTDKHTNTKEVNTQEAAAAASPAPRTRQRKKKTKRKEERQGVRLYYHSGLQ